MLFTMRGGLNTSDVPNWQVSLIPQFPTDLITTDPAAASAALSASLAASLPCNSPQEVTPATNSSGGTVGCTIGRMGQGAYMLAVQAGMTMYILPSPMMQVTFSVTGVTPQIGSVGGGTLLNITGNDGCCG